MLLGTAKELVSRLLQSSCFRTHIGCRDGVRAVPALCPVSLMAEGTRNGFLVTKACATELSSPTLWLHRVQYTTSSAGPPEHWGGSGGADSGSGSIPAPPVSQLRWLVLSEIPFLTNKSVSLCFQKGKCELDTQKHVVPAGPMC